MRRNVAASSCSASGSGEARGSLLQNRLLARHSNGARRAAVAGDSAELQSTTELIGKDGIAPRQAAIGSVKTMIGHTKATAGIAGMIKAALALHHKVLPPTINHVTDDPDIDSRLNLTFNTAPKRELNVVMSNTFGFGGHNSSIIFKKYEG
jgi:3-oxoacyl-[acyl-carrier-protein] synthase II